MHLFLFPVGIFGLIITEWWIYANWIFGSYFRADVLTNKQIPVLFTDLSLDWLVLGIALTWLSTRSKTGFVLSLLCCWFVVGSHVVAFLIQRSLSEALSTEILLIPGQIVLLALVMLTVGTFVPALVLLSRHQLGLKESGSRARWEITLLLSLVALLMWGAKNDAEATRISKELGVAVSSPTVDLATSVFGVYQAESPKPVKFSEELLAVGEAYGISVDTDRYAPLQKNWIYQSDLPWQRKRAAAVRPNVIVVMVESLSALLLEPYGGPKDMTPNLSMIASQPNSMVVDHYYNHTSPTLAGIVGQLCSHYPSVRAPPRRNQEGVSRPAVGSSRCLPHLLASQGYSTTSIAYLDSHLYNIFPYMVGAGFKELYFSENLGSELLDEQAPDLGERGLSDHQVFLGARNWLKRRASDDPFLLTLITGETHINWRTSKRKFSKGTTSISQSVYNLDAELGLFWEWFAQSPHFDNTLLVITGDHTMPPTDEMRETVTSPDYMNSRFGRLALIIHDPVHDLPARYSANTTSIDFAPSVLQLAEVDRQQSNAMLGVSMFTDREQYKPGAGFIFDRLMLYFDGQRPVIVDHRNGCTQQCDLWDFLHATRVLDRQNRLWKPDPLMK